LLSPASNRQFTQLVELPQTNAQQEQWGKKVLCCGKKEQNNSLAEKRIRDLYDGLRKKKNNSLVMANLDW
jgi:hypothetical protein